MAPRCVGCGADLGEIDVANAGGLARKWASVLACDECAAKVEKIADKGKPDEAREKSGIPFALASSFETLTQTASPKALSIAREWSLGAFPLLTLFGRDDSLPDQLAATAAKERLEIGGVRWFSAGDADGREKAVAYKSANAAVVLADVDQATLLKPALLEVFAVITHRQGQDLPLLVTSSVSGSELADRAGAMLVRRLRSWGKAVHVAEPEQVQQR